MWLFQHRGINNNIFPRWRDGTPYSLIWCFYDVGGNDVTALWRRDFTTLESSYIGNLFVFERHGCVLLHTFDLPTRHLAA